MEKIGNFLGKVNEHTEEISTALQAAQIAMTATAKINDWFYNENLRNAQETQTAVNELSGAYQTAQDNYASLLNGIEEYNTQTRKLTDNNLKGAEKQAAIYEQNQAALNLIDKYNITDFTRIGNTIKINESALEQAKEDSIQSASTAKYAMGLAKVDAKENQNAYLEEKLERDLVYDENIFHAGTVLAAGITGAAVGSFAGPIGTAVGAIAGTMVGAALAFVNDDLGEHLRNESYVDDAIKKTRETGSTSWMDDYSGDEFSAWELKQLKEQRSEIKNLAASQEAAEQMSEFHNESIAKDLLANNDRTEKFKYADRLIDGLVEQAESWQEQGSIGITPEQKIATAKSLNKELGLSGAVKWEDDIQNEVMTFTTADGQTGMYSYETLSRLAGTKKGKAEADKYINQMMDAYNYINDETVAVGMLSFLNSKNFDNATSEEAAQTKTYIDNLLKSKSENKYRDIARALGIQGISDTASDLTAQAFIKQYLINNGIENIESVQLDDALKNYFSSATSWESNVDKLLGQIDGYNTLDKNIDSLMTQATKEDLYSQLSYLQNTTGDVQSYLDSLSEILKDVDPDKTNQVMQALTSLDWSDWNIDDSIVEIMKEFGITIDNTNGSLENMVNIIREAASSIPNLEQEMTSLVQIMGSISNKKIGDTLDADVVQVLKDQNIDIDDYVFTTWDGKNILTKNPDTIKQDMKEEIAKTYKAYMDKVDKVNSAQLVQGMTDTTKATKLAEISSLKQFEFEEKHKSDKDIRLFISEVLGTDITNLLDNAINTRNILESKWKDYIEEDGKLYKVDDKGNKTETDRSIDDYRNDMRTLQQQKTFIETQYRNLIDAVGAAADPAEAERFAEQYASLFTSYEEAKYDSVIKMMMDNESLNLDDLLIAVASNHEEMSDDIKAFLDAIENNNTELANEIREDMEQETAMHASIANYEKATGKKITYAELESAKNEIKAELEKEKFTIDGVEKTRADLYTDEALTKLTEEALIAGNAQKILQSKGNTWISQIENMDSGVTGADTKGFTAAGELGKYLQQYLGLTEYTIKDIDKTGEGNPIIDILDNIDKNILNISMSKVLSGDPEEMAKLRAELVKQSTAGKNLTQKLKIGEDGRATKQKYEDGSLEYDMYGGVSSDAFTYNQMVNTFEASNEAAYDTAATKYGLLYAKNASELNTAVSLTSKGSKQAANKGFVQVRKPEGGVQTYNTAVIGDEWLVEDPTKPGYFDTADSFNINKNNIVAGQSIGDDGKLTKPKGGRGGGGGGPQKVAVKSAQEGMTRYKTVDQKTAQNEMLKTSALQAKDLLYGKSKINQLEKINLLLRKQQQLTSERITEELDYLEKDKKRMEEVIARYNKNLKEEEKITLEFDGNGVITNYKQVIGKWAEELSSFYLDGELTAEEGKKAEELQKKIADLNTVISDYEASLQELATSIEQYENTLYEMLSTEMEALNHQVEYNLDLSNDNLSYLNFYSSAIKDSMGSVIDYIELMNASINESITQIDIYKQGYNDLMSFVDENPLQLWATQGVEDIITAEQISTLRAYRDGLISVYNNALSIRKEIEDQILRVFDYWNKKLDKSLNSINKFTDMLTQFKDIVNVVGKDVLGLSNNFMQMFEQQSIDQSLDNIKASRIQYENLIKVYEDAQEKLNTARMSGNERDIEYWEEIVDKTQKSMEEMQNTLLTTLQHSLNAIAEQFTNTITIVMDEFNESVYKLKGLDGLIADYEQIKEYQDLMVADYEKIYSLNKLNRDLEKTLNNSNIVNGKQKLLEFQQKINEINKSNVELSQYELEYLQAEYELKVAEMELENARNSKDNVMLSKDSEGNWSYIYTQNAAVVEEAEQKVEDALYKMQQVSQEYTEEMSSAMMTISQQMRDEITELSIQDFESAEAYYAEIERIQNKYSAQLANREIELNKAISNSANLYEQDWMNYSEATGYKISAHEDWIDSFRETTFGGLLGSSSDISNYSDVIANSTDKMNEALGKAASTYFVNADKALNTYGTSLKEFGTTANVTTNQIINSSKNAIEEVTKFGSVLVDKFSEISDIVESELAEWTDEIGNKLEEMLSTIKEINNLISDSASKELPDTYEIIGQEEAVSRLTNADFQHEEFKNWKWNREGEVAIYQGNSEGWNLTEFNANLVKQVNEALQKYANTPTTDESGRQMALEELNKLIKDYWTFRRIIEKIYDPTNLNIDDLQIPDTGIATQMDTGGYTGEWGNEGKYAILHEKELVLNKDDTANFLDALNISRDVIHSIIEMNAKASSLAFGNLMPSSIQDMSQQLEQQVSIVAEFPGVTDRDEISEAFDNLINTASQYANRFKI